MKPEPEGKNHKIEIGTFDTVFIDKMFGPTIFANLRITASMERGWIIEREWIKDGTWLEWCTIPAQIEQEFTDESTPLPLKKENE